MPKPITVFLPYSGQAHTRRTIDQLKQSALVEKICLLATGGVREVPKGCVRIAVDSLYGSRTMQAIAQKSLTPYTLLVIHDTTIEFGQFALERLLSVAELTGSGMVYSDYHDIQGGKRVSHPVIEYQLGSIRDDFNFGSAPVLRHQSAQSRRRQRPQAELPICRPLRAAAGRLASTPAHPDRRASLRQGGTGRAPVRPETV